MVTGIRRVFAFLAITLTISAPLAASSESATSTTTSSAQIAAAVSAAAASVAASDAGEEAQSSNQGPLSKLTIHGFLTQAWADTTFLDGRLPNPDGTPAGPTFEELSLGITEDGTSSYRNMALQFRYQISPRDVMVVQLSSRALGNSPIAEFEDEVELDWAFYERRIADNTSIKVGRVQIPLGIFNEIRDVGTVLPFYRPSFTFYREGTFTSETVDGFDIGHTFWAESDWSLDADFYAGEWASFEQSFFDQGVTVARNKGYGFQLWLNTPVTGLRFGLGGHHRDVTGGSEGAIRELGATSRFDDWYASVDAVFDRWVFRSEYRQYEGDPERVPVFLDGIFTGKIIFYYAQVGFHATEKIRFYVQAEYNPNKTSATTFTRSLDPNFRDDIGFAFNYVFNPNLVLKAEYHDVKGEDVGIRPAFTPQGLRLDPFIVELDGGSYTIISLSASF
ncbi:MAG: hypothetical protein HC897_02145 [Thermoanaerobaculia bacterium]|nr:hypothetical protein [Thermoanaerobaculia bacterium]